MRAATLCVLAALSLPSHAVNKPDQRLFAESSLRELPTVSVFMGEYLLPDVSIGEGISFQLQWTADGQPMPSNLTAFNARCIYHSAQQYGCEALLNWFLDRPKVTGRVPVKSLFPQAFLIANLDFDTEYCFRFKPNDSSWTSGPARVPRPRRHDRPRRPGLSSR